MKTIFITGTSSGLGSAAVRLFHSKGWKVMKDQYQLESSVQDSYNNVFLIKPNSLFKNYIDSLLPYLENSRDISENLVRIKIKEAVLIFLESIRS